MPDKKILIFIPTYNERENVEKLFNEINDLNLNADFLFLDDNSPDGTGEVIDGIAKEHANVNVIHRPRKLGLGSAHIDGINWAYDHRYKTLITMDCDFAHLPKYIDDFIRESKNCDVVVGSRYLSAKSIEGWSLPRKVLTSMGHVLTKRLLNLEYDATGAYRLYRLDKIPRKIFSLIRSNDYSFFFESIYLLHVNRVSIKEVPIILPARNIGHSKLTVKQMFQWGKYLFGLYLLTSFDKSRFDISNGPRRNEASDMGNDNNNWDRYWEKKNNISGSIYDNIAIFYRKYIIKKYLNHFIKKYFRDRSASLLHAGCGSGEVDSDISKIYNVTSLDLSLSALNLNRTINNNAGHLIQGDIFNLPFPDSSFDGVYNLGVMEHFTENDINTILKEFKRVIKSDGKIILFWPPTFGLTVIFLKYVHFVLNRIFGRKSKLHPDEITQIKSKDHIKVIMDRAGLKIVEHSFNIRDMFTYYVVTCTK